MARLAENAAAAARPADVTDVPVRLLVWLGGAWAGVIVVVTLSLLVRDPASATSQLIGSVAFLAALVFAAAFCVAAARRPTPARLGWTLLAVGMGLGALGQLGWVLSALSGADSTPSPVLDTIAVLGYFVPTVAAIFAFPRRFERLISRYRQLLDVLVITVGVILMGEATVLRPTLATSDITTLEGLLRVAYPIADIAICALVLCLGMRQLPGDRLAWLFLGTGLLAGAVSDSLYVRLLAEGRTDLTATPLVAGWMAGPVLIGLATLVPMTGRHHRGRDYTLFLQLLPYLPVVGSLIVLFAADGRDLFMVVAGAVLLGLVTVRQVMIVYENVTLTRDLEAKVAQRTYDLTVLGSIVTSSTDAIVGVSRDDRITAWNPAAEALYGYASAQVLGREPDFLLVDTGTSIPELLDRADRGESLDGWEIDWRRPDDSVVPVAMSISPIVGAEGVQGISILAQDITTRRREAEALEHAREEALASARLKSEFLATMSHEIRTPMNAVIGLTSLLLETELDATQRTYAEGVQSAGDALLSVIDDILDFSKLEAGKVVLDQSDFNPRKLVEEIGALMAPAASAKGLELIAYCLPGVPTLVHGDATRIRQVLLNLASNAVKFTLEGEVIIKVALLSADEDRVRLRFEVIDTGIGIAEKDQGRLFESFSQGDASTTRRFGGTGLGLAICRRLVEVMGGSIGLESTQHVGSRFAFELPLQPATAPDSGSGFVPPDLLTGLRVLVVDDNSTNRTLLKAQLEAWQMLPELAEAAPRAYEMMSSAALQGRPYDVVALDAHMPDTDGLELARRISADPVLVGTPMIMLTSGLHPEPAIMRGAGITQWLPKPVRSAELFDRLMRLMAPRERELLARRRHQQGARRDPVPRGAVLVVDENPARKLVTRRILARLGYDAEFVGDLAEAGASVGRTTFAAVLVDLDPSEPAEIGLPQDAQAPEADRHTPVVAVVAQLTTEERERLAAAGIEHLVVRPLDGAALDAALSSLPPAQRPTGADRGRTDADQADAEPTAGELTDGEVTDGEATAGEPTGDAREPVIDTERLEELAELESADGTSLLRSLVESFLVRSPDRFDKLRRAAGSGDRDGVAATAHELRGSAGTIGALRLMGRAGELEDGIRAGGEAGAQQLDDLAAELDLARTELARIVGELDRPSADPEPAAEVGSPDGQLPATDGDLEIELGSARD